MEFLRSRRSLLVLLLVLGAQFCHPLAARTSDINPVTDVPGIGLQEGEGKVGSPLDLEPVPVILVVSVSAPLALHTPSVTAEAAQDPGFSVQPTTGLHPSAP